MKRLEFLDSLRGIAALYVVIFHTILVADPKLEVPESLATLFGNGGSGVFLFFVVSAFSLSLTWPRHEKSGMPLSSYFISRFFRIAPLFYFMMLVYYIRDILVFDAWHSFGKVAANALFLFNLLPGQQEGYVWASWTIGVEMLFYILFPLFYFYATTLWKRLALVFATGIVALIYFSILPHTKLTETIRFGYENFGLLRFLPIFAMGILAFDLAGRLAERPDCEDIGMAAVALGVLLYAAILGGYFLGNAYMQSAAYTFTLVGLSAWPMRLYVNPLSRFYGRISYSVYLLHPPIVFALSPAYLWIYEARIGKSVWISFSLSLLLTLAIVTPLAMLTFRFVEQPGVTLGKWLFLRLQQKRGAVPQAAATS